MHPNMDRLYALSRTCTLMGALLAGVGGAWAQALVPPSGPLYHIRDSMSAHFDSLHAVLPDSLFYAEGGEHNHFQRWFNLWEARLAPHGDFAVYDEVVKNYWESLANNNSMLRSNEDSWHEVGPKRRTNNMIGIGPIRSITISDDDPDHMLCTSGSGGLFYTTNGAEEWNNAGTDQGWPHSGCQFSVYYPGLTNRWYALSAYETTRANRISKVGGVYRTFNGGDDWMPIADYTVLGGVEEGANTEVVKLIFDRKLNSANDHRLFLATSRGLYVSDDPASASPTWTQLSVPTPPSITGAFQGYTVNDNVHVHDIEYLPYDEQDATSTLCAAMRFTLNSGNNEVKVWRFMLSTDNGDTWSECINQPAINTAIQWATVETSTAASTSFYCQALISNSGSWVLKYDTSDDSWTPMASGFYSDFARGHAFGVDQSDANSVFIGNGVLMRWYLNQSVYPGSPGSQGFQNGHDDVEDIVSHISQPDVLWVANHGGVSRVEINRTPQSTTWVDKSNGLGVAEVWSMSTSQNKPDYIALGLYHDANVMTRGNYSEPWEPDWDWAGSLYGDGTFALIDHTDANVVYVADQQNRWQRLDNAESSMVYSEDWSSSQFYQKGSLNRQNTNYLYYSDKNSGRIEVKRSFQSGINGIFISDFTSNPEISNQNSTYQGDQKFWWIHSNPVNPDHLYVGLLNHDWQNRIFRNTVVNHADVSTVKGGWHEIPHPRRAPLGSQDDERHAPPLDIAFDTNEEHVLYIAYASSESRNPEDHQADYARKMVYKLDISDLNAYPQGQVFDCDGGIPCMDLTMNLPNTFMDKDCLALEQGSDGGLYVATEAGVYFTNNKRIAAFDPDFPESADDTGNSSGWVRLGSELPHVRTRGLEINYQVNRIRVAFTGRGVWEHDLYCPTVEEFNETGTYIADEFLEALNDIISEALVPDGLKVDYRAGNVVRFLPGFHAEAGARFHAFIHPCNAPGNSFKPKSMPGEADDFNDRPDVRSIYMEPIDLFPNPASGHLSLRCKDMKENETAQVLLFDATGKQAMAAVMRGPLLRLDVTPLNGLFMVVVNRGSERFTGRVIIY